MKALFSFILLSTTLSLTAQEAKSELEPENGPIITFTEKMFDFGEITQGDVVEHTFVFENTGNTPMIISNAKGSCGCTVPQYSRETAIAPGETSEMLVRFNSRGKSGTQSKTVTVYSNAQNSPEVIRIRASITIPPPVSDQETGEN